MNGNTTTQGTRNTVTPERVEQILDDLDVLVRRTYVDGEIERDWDAADFARYARSLPELDETRADDLEGEIWLVDGTVLVRDGWCWEVALEGWPTPEQRDDMALRDALGSAYYNIPDPVAYMAAAMVVADSELLVGRAVI